MVVVTFRYRDEMSDWEWQEQDCVVSSVDECIRIYGLGKDCDYQILDVVEVHKQKGGRA